MKALLRAIYDFFCSLRLAVGVIVGLTLALMVATFLESIYDTRTAQYFVYQSTWFTLLLGGLGLNIFFVAISRYPWKLRHTPFLLAHIGILMLLYGSWLTQKFGVDGIMVLSEGQSSSGVELSEDTLTLVGTKSDAVQLKVPWVPPMVEFKPLKLGHYDLVIEKMITHSKPMVAFDAGEGGAAAIQLRVEGAPMGASGDTWLWAGDATWASTQMGPARMAMLPDTQGFDFPEPSGEPALLFQLRSGKLHWQAHGRDKTKQGGVLALDKVEGSVLNPGWMAGMKVRITRFIPQAVNNTTYVPAYTQYGQGAPASAIYLKTQGGDGVWLGLGDRGVLVHGEERIQVIYEPRRVALPFALKLDRFEITYYDGTQTPKEYASRVRVTDPFLISMNEPLEHEGYTFYQSSYVPGNPRPTTTVLSVNRDPGRVIKYLGSLLIVIGAVLLFGYKSIMSRRNKLAQGSLALLLALGAPQASASPGEPHEGWDFSEAQAIPIKTGGRIKPLGSFASDLVLFLTGRRTWNGWEPMDMMLSMISAPDAWEDRTFVRINHPEVRRQLLVDANRKYFSPRELLQSSSLAQYATGMQHQVDNPTQATKMDPRKDELKRVVERVRLYQALKSGGAWQIIPERAPKPWLPLAMLNEKGELEAPAQTPEAKAMGQAFAGVVRAYYEGKAEEFAAAAEESQRRSEVAMKSVGEWSPELARNLRVENTYHNLRPFFWSWVLYVVAGLLFFLGLMGQEGATFQRMNYGLGFLTVAVGLGFNIYGFIARMMISGRPPVSNMYESVIWVGFGTVVFALILFAMYRHMIVMASASLVAGLAMVSADLSPAVLDPSIQPLVAVLRSNFWLTTHVLTITLSYAAFAVSLGLGNVALFHFMKKGEGYRGKTAHLNLLSYRAMQFGVVLLAAGTILGGVWADKSWGRFWGWDPKEVWALAALLAYLAVLHARFVGWVGQFAFAAWSVVCFTSVVMAWYGVNFVLGEGLHSYGWASGGNTYVGAMILGQMFYVLLAWWIHEKGRMIPPSASASSV